MKSQVKTIIHERVELNRLGLNPKAVGLARSGWVVMGDVQFLEGYCLLLPDPVVTDLNSMELPVRSRFLNDMSLVGDAIQSVTRCVRLNYEILGNADPALHAHIFPRFIDEPDELRTRSAFFYDWKKAPPFDPVRHLSLQADLALELQRRFLAEELSFEIAPHLAKYLMGKSTTSSR